MDNNTLFAIIAVIAVIVIGIVIYVIYSRKNKRNVSYVKRTNVRYVPSQHGMTPRYY